MIFSDDGTYERQFKNLTFPLCFFLLHDKISKNIDKQAIKMQAIEDIILGKSLVIKEMKKLIEMVSSSNTTVLIQGETGTGKELVA